MSLATAWEAGAEGTLPPREQAKLWGLRCALGILGQDTDQYEQMRSHVELVGGGHPSRQAVRQFFARVDSADHWYPGMRPQQAGRPTVLSVLHQICKHVAMSRTVPLACVQL